MKNWLTVLTVLCVCSCACVAGTDRSVRMMFRDYRMTDAEIRPVSAGAVLWESRHLPNHPGVYGSLSMLTYGKFRAETGGIATWNEKDRRTEIAVLTGVSYQVYGNWVVGMWMAPFWNTYGTNPDDAWGLMVGYTWGVN